VSQDPGRELLGRVDPAGLRVAVVVSTYNPGVTDGLLKGALDVLTDAEVVVARVPGAFELPIVAKALAPDHDAVVALGAVVKGETDHYEHVAREASNGLQRVALETGVPIGFGLLTVERLEHALARSGPDDNNKGREAAEAAVRTARLLAELRQ
jgi:6,7-dimethyl-8-ribityllumazine synthase